MSHSHLHVQTEMGGSLIVSNISRDSHYLWRASFKQLSFICFFIPLPLTHLHNWVPSISPFTLTLFLTPLVSRTQSSTGWGKGGEIDGVKKNEKKVWLLGEIKCNFTVNLLWYIISQQWDVGWYEPLLGTCTEQLEHQQWLSRERGEVQYVCVWMSMIVKSCMEVQWGSCIMVQNEHGR